MATESPKNLVPKFFENTASSYDKIVFRTTFGKDKFWKEQILKQITDGNLFLDLACGTGILTRKIAQKFPNAWVVGVDITQSYLDIAKSNSKSYQNISFKQQDAENLKLGTKFDCITSSYIPKYCDPKILVKNCVSHLNLGGQIILHDFVYPKSKIIRFLWNLYFVLLKFVGCFNPDWKEAFSELPKLIKASNWDVGYEEEMKKNGLKVKRYNLTCNSSAILVGSKPLLE